ncbi:MAG: hypothetical protein RLZZ436_936 [Planctomycetota bacterium]
MSVSTGIHGTGQVVVAEFLESPGRRYLFGATPCAAAIASVLPVVGIIDDRIDATSFHGLPILRSESVPADALVVATTIGRPGTARRYLLSRGFRHCDFFAFERCSGLNLPPVRFWTGFSKAAVENPHEIDLLRKRMADRISLETLDAIVSFRLSADSAHLDHFQERQQEQYFEDFLELRRHGEVFFDVGGFDGENSRRFMELCPDFSGIQIFEPDPANRRTILARLAEHPRVQLHAHGLGDINGEFRFSSSGSVSAFCESGDLAVPVKRLDDCNPGPVSFLKMDIEGGEIPALRGARRTVKKWKPRMAICVYHEPDDLWNIAGEVLAIHSDYSVFLRHYTEGVTETVMFFVPPQVCVP